MMKNMYTFLGILLVLAIAFFAYRMYTAQSTKPASTATKSEQALLGQWQLDGGSPVAGAVVTFAIDSTSAHSFSVYTSTPSAATLDYSGTWTYDGTTLVLASSTRTETFNSTQLNTDGSLVISSVYDGPGNGEATYGTYRKVTGIHSFSDLK